MKNLMNFSLRAQGPMKGTLKKSGQTFDFVQTGEVIWTGTPKGQTNTLKR